jgi:hypothetical protein
LKPVREQYTATIAIQEILNVGFREWQMRQRNAQGALCKMLSGR